MCCHLKGYMMHSYKYETHTHTSQVSKCSKVTAQELVRFYKARGYSGLFVTDHFLNGNTTVSKELPWEESIGQFCGGYEQAYEEGKKIGLDVFFGWEYSYFGTDFLTYGLDKDWLMNHPNLLELTVNEYCDLVRGEGGFIVHAHPFREAGYIEMIRLFPRKVDAVEVINSERTDFENRLAAQYADNYGLSKFAGSDIHSASKTRLSGLEFEKRLKCANDMAQAAKSGKARLFDENPV